MSAGQLIAAYWSQALRRSHWWQASKPDGMDVLLIGNLFALEAFALTHLCPRCLTQTNKVLGDSIICGVCKLRSAPTYRVIRVLVERSNEGAMVDKLERLAIRDLNPLALLYERTEIDLGKAWDQFDPEREWPEADA